MNGFDVVEAREIPWIEGQNPPDSVDRHSRHKPGIVNLGTADSMRDEETPPDEMHFGRVREHVHIAFENLCAPVRL